MSKNRRINRYRFKHQKIKHNTTRPGLKDQRNAQVKHIHLGDKPKAKLIGHMIVKVRNNE